MAEFTSPSEIAREVLRQLAIRRMPPTPENFREIYHEIAGTVADDPFPERILKQLASSLPRANAEQLKVARQFEAAVEAGNWPAFKQQLGALLTAQVVEHLPWGPLIRDTLAQVERRQAGLNSVTKQEALQRVLESSSGDPSILHQRLQALIKGWSQLPGAATLTAEAVASSGETVVAAVAASAPAAEASANQEAWRNTLATVLETAVGMLLIDTPELATEASAIAKALRNPAESSGEAFEQRLKQFAYKVQWVAQDQSHIRQALLNLLQLIIENISELTIDDQWMQGQMAVLLELFARPLDKDILAELSERLRDVIHKQGTLKRNLSDAQDRLRHMLAYFIDQLGELAESTGSYHNKISVFAERINSAGSLQELANLVDEIAKETHLVEQSAKRSRSELQALRGTVDQAYKEIARLEEELVQASELVRHDPLTGALNRKGIDEMLSREVARMERRQSQLCVALLDVDDFKKLNDTFGHTTGDDALKHLAQVIRDNLRPQDSCGRYGGEEFVILLPDSALDNAAQVLRRLQREMTKRFFMHDNQKLLITFSAGVTELRTGEEPQHAIERADQAMYRAKRAGKNRVETG